MKIIHIITGLGDGGAENVLFRLCKSTAQLDHCVISLTDKGKYGPLLEGLGVRVEAINMKSGHFSIVGFFKLINILRSEKPDVVQTWMYHSDLIGGIAARLAGARNLIWGLHNSNLDPAHVKHHIVWAAKICAKLSRVLPRRIISCSRRATDIHIELGYASDKFTVISNGLDLREFVQSDVKRNAFRAEIDVNAATPLLGMIARFDPLKDHGNIIQALAILRKLYSNITLVLVGSGMDKDNQTLVKMITDAGLSNHIQLLGQRNDIPAVMNGLDLHILSSYGEAFPNVLVEAMACGTPCVTTDVGDAAFIVDEYGWVAPSKNPKLLAVQIATALRVIETPNQKQILADNCRARAVNNFGVETMAERYLDVWKNEQTGL